MKSSSAFSKLQEGLRAHSQRADYRQRLHHSVSGDPTLIGEKYVGSTLRRLGGGAAGGVGRVVDHGDGRLRRLDASVDKENPQGFIRVICTHLSPQDFMAPPKALHGALRRRPLARAHHHCDHDQQLRKPIDWLAESLSLIAEGNFKSLRPYRRNDEFTPLLNL